MSTTVLIALSVGVAHGLMPGPLHSSLTRRNALALASSLPAVFLGRPAHAEGEITPATCKAECFKECNAVAPGNQGYCATQCDSFCDEAAKLVTADRAETELPPQADLDKNLGIFGDSGVAYSRGAEDFFATAFGATRQSKDVRKANAGEFAGEVGNAFKAAITGGK